MRSSKFTNHSYFIYIVEETVKCNNCNTTTDGMVIIFNQGEKVISLCKYCSANLQEILYCYLKGIEHIPADRAEAEEIFVAAVKVFHDCTPPE